MDYTFTLRTILPYIGELWPAAEQTLTLSVLAILISLAIGAGVAVLRRGRSRLGRGLAGAYVEVMRNTPLLVILYLVYFAAPGIGIRLSSFAAALIGLSLNSGGYMAEIFRAGLAAVPPGQSEASRSLGLSALQTFRLVAFPQVLRTIYAPLGNQFISVILASSLASAVAVEEVASWMETTGSTSFRFFETFLVAACVYLVLCQTVNLLRLGVGRMLFRAEAAR
ncbi:MAG TPA: amino acid ABC transporter permease [Acetobacteraceae bacterium]